MVWPGARLLELQQLPPTCSCTSASTASPNLRPRPTLITSIAVAASTCLGTIVWPTLYELDSSLTVAWCYSCVPGGVWVLGCWVWAVEQRLEASPEW